MPFYSMSLDDIANHNCAHPTKYTPGLVYERWKCPECGSEWVSNRYENSSPTYWRRTTRSSRKWRKKKRKQIQENLDRP